MKRIILAIALLGSLASCSKKEDAPAPAAVAQTSLLVGNWSITTSRHQKFYDKSPASNTDVTITISGRQYAFKADNTYVYNANGYLYPGTYKLDGTALTFDGNAMPDKVLELTATRFVHTFTQAGGPDTRDVYTNTYVR